MPRRALKMLTVTPPGAVSGVVHRR